MKVKKNLIIFICFFFIFSFCKKEKAKEEVLDVLDIVKDLPQEVGKELPEDIPQDLSIDKIEDLKEAEIVPSEWGPATFFNAIEIPSENDSKNTCPDLTNDKVGDNGFAKILKIYDINKEIPDAIKDGRMSFIGEFEGVKDFVNTEEFIFNFYNAVYGEKEDEFLISSSSLDDQGFPLNHFDNSKIVNSSFEGVTNDFYIYLKSLVIDWGYQLKLKQVKIKGEVALTPKGGVLFKNGILSGVLSQSSMEDFFKAIGDYCGKFPGDKPLYCTFIKVINPSDLCKDYCDINNEAMSICIRLEGIGAKIVGVK